MIVNELETEAKKMIISRYGTVKKFADTINLPYSTVDTILKRGFKNSNAYNVGLIFGALGLDTSSLLDGKIKLLKPEILIDELNGFKDFESFEDFEGLSDTCIDEMTHSGKFNDNTTHILELLKKMDRKGQYITLKLLKYLTEHDSNVFDSYFNNSSQNK